MRESRTRGEAMQMVVAIDGQSITVGAMTDTQFLEYLRGQVLAISPTYGPRYFEEEYGDIREWDPDTRWWALDNLGEIRRKAYLTTNSRKYYAKTRERSA